MSTSNRVTQGVQDWNDYEKSQHALYGDQLYADKKFLKDKLRTFRKIYRETRPTKDPAERRSRKSLKGQIDLMEKSLYSWKKRAARSIGRGLIRGLSLLLKPAMLLWKKLEPRLQPAFATFKSRFTRDKSAIGRSDPTLEPAQQPSNQQQKDEAKSQRQAPLQRMHAQRKRVIVRQRNQGMGPKLS